jgi:hypothetical protein
MIRILQSTIERLMYVVLLLVFIGMIIIYIKISYDDDKKFRVLKSNQDQLICIVNLGFQKMPPVSRGDVDNCIKNNKP